MEPTADLKTLIEKWISGEISPGEKTQFYGLIEDKNNEVEFRSIMAELYDRQGKVDDSDEAWEQMVQAILSYKTQRKIPLYKKTWFRIAAAASILAFTFITARFLTSQKAKSNPSEISITKADISPASNKAVLVLSTGQKIILDSARNGLLAKLGNTSVTKTDSGKLLYASSENAALKSKPSSEETSFNTLTTPRGGIYELQLPDGTKAWLNAASRISYPTRFTSKNREVFIEGEIYFEVAKDASHPFVVSVSHSLQIEVLGTHFNVNAYADNNNPTRTTLLEGSIKITTNKESRIIKPGEQAIAEFSKKEIEVRKEVDVDKVMAWRNGKISITDVSVQQLMSEISRWYDMDIEYKGPIPNKDFYGTIRRDVPLSTVLNALKTYGVETKVEGKKIIVQ